MYSECAFHMIIMCDCRPQNLFDIFIEADLDIKRKGSIRIALPPSNYVIRFIFIARIHKGFARAASEKPQN